VTAASRSLLPESRKEDRHAHLRPSRTRTAAYCLGGNPNHARRRPPRPYVALNCNDNRLTTTDAALLRSVLAPSLALLPATQMNDWLSDDTSAPIGGSMCLAGTPRSFTFRALAIAGGRARTHPQKHPEARQVGPEFTQSWGQNSPAKPPTRAADRSFVDLVIDRRRVIEWRCAVPSICRGAVTDRHCGLGRTEPAVLCGSLPGCCGWSRHPSGARRVQSRPRCCLSRALASQLRAGGFAM
jgi:hypothetical protein